MSQSEPRSRPGLVTFAVVLLYIGGIAQIILGILTIFLRYVPDAGTGSLSLVITLFGVAMILFGLFMIALASGVARGSRMSRLVVTVIMGLAVALAVVDLVVAADGDWSGVVTMLVAAAAVTLPLWLGPGRRYFEVRRAAA